MLRHGLSCLAIFLIGAFLGVSTEPAAAQSLKKVKRCQAISKPGSYIVTRNLPGRSGLRGNDCLIVRTNFVTIDLGGFVLRGNGKGSGITDQNRNRRSISVRNGTITGFKFGVSLGETVEAVIRDLQVVANGSDGIRAGEGCIIRDNVASRNGGEGIFARDGACLVEDNVANSNDQDGLQLDGSGHTVSGNTANGNESDGIEVQCPSSLIGNTALQNERSNLNEIDGPCLKFRNLAP